MDPHVFNKIGVVKQLPQPLKQVNDCVYYPQPIKKNTEAKLLEIQILVHTEVEIRER